MADIPNDVDAKLNDNKDHDSKEKYIDTVNPEDPEYQRELIRPAVIKEDMKEMERRKRVSLILNSQAFREELEQIVESQIMTGPHPASLIALQQISELLLPHSRFNQTAGPALGRGYSAVTPIADIRGLDSQNYTKGEKIIRCKLASLYRVLDLHGWTHFIYNHVSVRISHEADHFLVNPYGLLYHEISASGLIKVDMQGNTVDPGSTNYPANKIGWSLHAAIHSSRPSVKCIIELHTPAAAAISCMKCGLLRCCDEACVLGDISYHDYTGMIVDKNDRDSITRALGPNNKVLVQRNHGILVCGETIEEAYFLALNAMTACETQIKLLTCCNIDNLVLVDEAMSLKAKEIASIGIPKNDDKRKWRVGELEFEAMMRWLDNMGHRTGYIYHQPLIKTEDKKKFSDVMTPPASTSFTYVHEGDVESSKYEPPLKMAQRRAAGEKTKWLTTPNAYTKVEVTINDEEGEGSSKTKTKWVTEGETGTGESIKVQDPQQFAKQGEDPKEFRKRQKEIKQDRRDDRIHAGPVSDVLSGVAYPGSRLQDARSSGSGDNVQAASKGIIQRDYQKEAIVYTTYSPNPFEGMSEKDILRYKEEIANKTGQDLSEIQFPAEESEKELSTNEDIMTEETTTETVTRKEGDQEIVTTVTTVKQTVIETDIDAEPEKGGEESRTSTLDHEKDDSSKDSSPTKETSPKKKDKEKKKKGFRTPSFLKKKDKKGKGEEEE